MPQLRMTGRGLWITALIVPPLVFVALFIVYPIVSAFAYAFFDWQGLRRGDFVGLENFWTVLFVEPYRSWTINAFSHNVIVFFALMVLQNGLGFILAYALWRELPGARFHRIAVFLAGSGWVVVGAPKLLAGSFLVVLVLNAGVPSTRAADPAQMYHTAFGYMIPWEWATLLLMVAFVVVSQLKINVMNAYAGSLAWSRWVGPWPAGPASCSSTNRRPA